MLDTASTRSDRQKGVMFVGDVTEHFYRSADHLFQFAHKPFPVEISQLIADEIMRDSADGERWKRIEVAHQDRTIIKDIEVGSVVGIRFACNGVEAGRNGAPPRKQLDVDGGRVLQIAVGVKEKTGWAYKTTG